MTLKLWQSSAAALLTLMYWVAVVSLPERFGKWQHGWVVGLTWCGVVMTAIGLVVFGLGFLGREIKGFKIHLTPTGEHRGEWVFVGFFLFFAGGMLIAGVHAAAGGFTLGAGQRMALGVGGAAMVGFVFAATQLTTMRVAASVPVVLLLIGITTWPDARTLVDPGIQKALITWMGVILGVNSVSEVVNQRAVNRARAEKGDFRLAPGDLARPDESE
jgi:hypothetical protein